MDLGTTGDLLKSHEVAGGRIWEGWSFSDKQLGMLSERGGIGCTYDLTDDVTPGSLAAGKATGSPRTRSGFDGSA